MKKLIGTLVASTLFSCASSPQIHLFSLGVESQDIEKLSVLLEAGGFDVRPSSLLVPAAMTKSTLVFPAIVQDFAMVEAIEAALASSGFSDTRLVLETEANHHYSTNNIGIYLIDPEANYDTEIADIDPYALGGSSDSNLTYNYFSECPPNSPAQSELNLFPSGAAILEEFIWDDKAQREINRRHEGEWTADSSNVSIDMFELGELRLTISKYTGEDWQGPFEGITLVNAGSMMDIEVCNYTHRNYR